jgi:murein DD-endopeptidase MepM/ murein hydrolase activator NlpD
VPVRGIAAVSLADTYADARSEGRSHDAIDIMAPAGTPVLAAADGHVEKLFTSDRGGLTLYQFEPGGRYAYYYAHLQAYAPGLHEKQQLRQGEVVGYVGRTGNASADAPHLHFAIFVLGPEKQWWEGTAINPYPLLHGKAP